MEDSNSNKKIVQILTLVVLILAGFTLVMAVFATGIWVGQKRAEFSFAWAQNYHRNFGGPKKGVFGNFLEQDFTNAHGAAGVVLTIGGNTIIIRGQENMETSVTILKDTDIVNQSGNITLSDIKVGDNIVIIGSPDQRGVIEAKFIRVFPPNSIIPTPSYFDRIILK